MEAERCPFAQVKAWLTTIRPHLSLRSCSHLFECPIQEKCRNLILFVPATIPTKADCETIARPGSEMMITNNMTVLSAVGGDGFFCIPVTSVFY